MHRFLLALLLSALPAQAGLTGWGTGNYATTPAQVIQVPCTISIWIRSNSSGSNQCMMCLSDLDDDTKMWLGTGSSFKCETMNAAGSAAPAASDGLAPLATGLWRHVVGVFASTTDRRIYVNGFGGFASTSKTIDSTIDTLFLGVLNANSTISNATNSASALAQVAVWDAALTPQQVMEIYTGTSPLNVARGSLKHWIPCTRNPPVDEVTGATMTVTGSLTLTEDPPKGTRNAGMGSDTFSGILGSKLVAEYEGDTQVTGNPVTAWGDPVGGFNLSGVAGTPDYVAGPNGRHGVSFVAASSEALYSSSSPITVEPYHLLVAFKVVSLSDAGFMSFVDKDVDNQHFYRFDWNANLIRYTANNGTSSSAQDDDAPAVGTVHVAEAVGRTSGTIYEARMDASHYGTGATQRAPTGLDRFALGGLVDSAPTYGSAVVYEVLICNAEMSDNERRRVYVLLDHKWGPLVDQEWAIGVFDP